MAGDFLRLEKRMKDSVQSLDKMQGGEMYSLKTKDGEDLVL
jgi:hypothetical protein